MSKQKRILVVDDDEKNRNLLKHMLEPLGYQPELAQDGTEALAKFNSDIDLVLLDVMMPGMDGFEVARRIRSHRLWGDVPIIMVTILTGKEDRIHAVEAGANDFLTKPIDRLELRVRLDSLLRMKEAQDAIKRHRDELEQEIARRTADLQESERRCRDLYEESRRREELYHSFVTASPDAVVIYDMEGRARYVSPSFTRIFGWAFHEIEGRTIPFVPELERERTSAYIEKVIRDGEAISSLETCRYCKDGSLIDTSVSASRYHDHTGNPAGMVVILHEITERKRMERALRESEERFRHIFEAAQDCIFLKDRELRYTDVNPALTELLQMPHSAIVGKTDEDLLSGDYVLQARGIESRVLEGQTIETQQTLVCNSLPVTLDFMRFPMRGASGVITGICGIARDITERTQLPAEPHIAETEYPSSAMRSAMELVRLAAKTDSIVLFLGESGSGKDYLARYLHDLSNRASGPFFSINCAALPHELAESELFGHEPGAFTGSVGRKRGLLELAEGGSLLLNEIGDLSLGLQAKLLTFLDTQTFTRVGGEKNVEVNARLIAATNRDLRKEAEAGNFREDLFYRLSVFVITVPPLRQRIEDLPLIVQDTIEYLARRMGLNIVPKVAPDALDALANYHWPGNVRELRNMLERALILCKKNYITIEDLGISMQVGADPDSTGISITLKVSEKNSMNETIDEAKRLLVIEALTSCNGNVSAAARALGVSRDALRHHMKALNITRGFLSPT